jgi:catechol 2,3-dioxygenase-like lactoylglutathione lyase family enzyme
MREVYHFRMNYRLELVIVPVSDVDRAKAFYAEQLGFNVDVDVQPNEHVRVVQLTPPGSACSITLGPGDSPPGSLHGLHLVVADIEAAYRELTARGVELAPIHHYDNGVQTPGVHPGRGDYESFSSFHDPDGNTWVLQEVPSRG